jgi:hypothetical protein
MPQQDSVKPNMLLIVILSVVVVVFLLVIVALAAYICRHRRQYAASNGVTPTTTTRSGLSSSSANSNVMYMQKFPLGGSAVVGSANSRGNGLANFHQLKVNTLNAPLGPLRRPLWAVSSSSAASASADSLDSPARVSSEVGGGSGSEPSYVSRSFISKSEAGGGGNHLGNGVVGNNLKTLPIIGEENHESVLSSSTTYQPYPAPSPGSADGRGQPYYAPSQGSADGRGQPYYAASPGRTDGRGQSYSAASPGRTDGRGQSYSAASSGNLAGRSHPGTSILF